MASDGILLSAYNGPCTPPSRVLWPRAAHRSPPRPPGTSASSTRCSTSTTPARRRRPCGPTAGPDLTKVLMGQNAYLEIHPIAPGRLALGGERGREAMACVAEHAPDSVAGGPRGDHRRRHGLDAGHAGHGADRRRRHRRRAGRLHQLEKFTGWVARRPLGRRPRSRSTSSQSPRPPCSSPAPPTPALRTTPQRSAPRWPRRRQWSPRRSRPSSPAHGRTDRTVPDGRRRRTATLADGHGPRRPPSNTVTLAPPDPSASSSGGDGPCHASGVAGAPPASGARGPGPGRGPRGPRGARRGRRGARRRPRGAGRADRARRPRGKVDAELATDRRSRPSRASPRRTCG